MKRQRNYEKTETDVKRQKIDNETGGSMSTISQQEENDKNDSDKVAEETGISLLEEEVLHIDRGKDLGTKETCQISNSFGRSGDDTGLKLEGVFAFGTDTGHVRTHSNEYTEADKNQSVKTASNNSIIIKRCLEIESVTQNIPATSNFPLAPSSANQMKDERNQEITDTCNTVYNCNEKCVAISNIVPESPQTAIYVSQLKEWILPNAPNQVPTNYGDISPKRLPTEKGGTFFFKLFNRQKPDQQTNILILHKFANKPEEDDFGAALRTYKEHLEYGKIYYRHFFEKVEPNQPASEMKIKNDDELVLLNDMFVPALNHTNVMNLFHRVKVDGKTRLSLVIRRKLTEQKWEWIETSAVLAPEKQREAPAVDDLKYEELEGDKTIYRPMSKHLYKVPGSEKYIDIHDGIVRLATMNDSNKRTKIIWKQPRFWQVDTEGHIDFATTLSDLTKKWYIVIDQKDQIVVERKPVWFKMITVGNNIRFQYQKLYLGYDRECDKLKAQVSDCVFEELPASLVDTEKDISENETAEDVLEYAQNETEQPSGVQPLHINVGSSQIDINAAKNTDVSTLSSADSGFDSGFDYSRRSSYSTENSELLSGISSPSSETTGYESSTP